MSELHLISLMLFLVWFGLVGIMVELHDVSKAFRDFFKKQK